MLSNKKNLRLAAAVGLYKKGKVTLGKAAEIADVGILEFKERLKEYGIKG
jgi:predicted HTH domain antitoxin